MSMTPSRAAESGMNILEENDVDPLRRLKATVTRSKREFVQLTDRFLSRVKESDPSPPLARFLRGGRGGEVRLKLYLTICLLAAGRPYDVHLAPYMWAEMLALPQHTKNGARRIKAAIKWLENANLINVLRASGKNPHIFLLDQTGTGREYRRPEPRREHYASIPVELWENGWILQMSAAALAVFIILIDRQRGRSGDDLIWIRSPWRYDLSQDTWARGTKLLSHLGLLTVTRGVRGDDLEWRRLRNLYWVNLEGLMEEAQNRNVGR